MNENVLNGCKSLKDYVILISKIRENYNEIGDLAKAIHKAVYYCIEAYHLRSFLIRNRAEVEPMLLSEGTVEEYVDSMNEVKEQEIERLKRELSKGNSGKKLGNCSIKSLTCSKRKQIINTAGEVII